jgi:hypothetical protein
MKRSNCTYLVVVGVVMGEEGRVAVGTVVAAAVKVVRAVGGAEVRGGGRLWEGWVGWVG